MTSTAPIRKTITLCLAVLAFGHHLPMTAASPDTTFIGVGEGLYVGHHGYCDDAVVALTVVLTPIPVANLVVHLPPLCPAPDQAYYAAAAASGGIAFPLFSGSWEEGFTGGVYHLIQIDAYDGDGPVSFRVCFQCPSPMLSFVYAEVEQVDLG